MKLTKIESSETVIFKVCYRNSDQQIHTAHDLTFSNPAWMFDEGLTEANNKATKWAASHPVTDIWVVATVETVYEATP
jgi:superfamily I DNA and RNA helicase